MEYPLPPRLLRWFAVAIALAVTLCGAVIVWAPTSWQAYPLWYACCAVLLPITASAVLVSIRWRCYEQRREYVDSWNGGRDRSIAALTERAQRVAEVLAVAYCTAAGVNHLAQAIGLGSRPLQSHFTAERAAPTRYSALAPEAKAYTSEEHANRLAGFFQQLASRMDDSLRALGPGQHLHTRICHEQLLPDDQVLALWQQVTDVDWPRGEIVMADGNHGMMWLEEWLDASPPVTYVLSIEVNLFEQPLSGHAELVTAVLMGMPGTPLNPLLRPLANVHRPIQIVQAEHHLRDVLHCAGVAPQEEPAPFMWSSQTGADLTQALRVALYKMGCEWPVSDYHDLDGSLGRANAAAANLCLIVASEQARDTCQPQFLVLNSVSLQCCVVQPALEPESETPT